MKRSKKRKSRSQATLKNTTSACHEDRNNRSYISILDDRWETSFSDAGTTPTTTQSDGRTAKLSRRFNMGHGSKPYNSGIKGVGSSGVQPIRENSKERPNFKKWRPRVGYGQRRESGEVLNWVFYPGHFRKKYPKV